MLTDSPSTSRLPVEVCSVMAPVGGAVATTPPSTSSQPSTSKQAFDDSCFKTPLPPSANKPRRARGRGRGSAARVNGQLHIDPPTPKTSGGGRGGRGGATRGGARGGGGRGGRGGRRIIPQKPTPPLPKFELHDMFCPHTTRYLRCFKVPKYASLPSEEILGNDEEMMDQCSTDMKDVKDVPECSKNGSNLTKLKENGQVVKTNGVLGKNCNGEDSAPTCSKTVLSHVNESGLNVGASTSSVVVADMKTEADMVDVKVEPTLTPFVEELIIDEFSLLLFTSHEDEEIFDVEQKRIRSIIVAKRRKRHEDRKRKVLRLKRRMRRKIRVIEATRRAQRKRQRALKRERIRRVRKERHLVLKKAVKEAKAAGTLTKELKAQWKLETDRTAKRRAEKVKRRAEHEARKEARRVKRDKGRKGKNRKRRQKKAKEAKLAKAKKAPKAARGRKMKSPGAMGDNLALKRNASQTPSPAPHKTPRLEDTYRNGIIGIAKSDTSSTSTPLPVAATPPGILPASRTPLSVDSKPHTTSAESAHPSDPGHRAGSATPMAGASSSLFVNTSSSNLLTPANGLMAGMNLPPGMVHPGQLDTLRLLQQNPGLLQQNPFLAAAAGGGAVPFLAMMQQQLQQQLHQQAQSGGANAAAALLQQQGQMPYNQLAASAALLAGRGMPMATPTPKKPARWCKQHVTMAQEIQSSRKNLHEQDLKAQNEARMKQEVKPDVNVQMMAAVQQQQHHAALMRQAQQTPHCMPSTSGAQGMMTLAGLHQAQAAQAAQAAQVAALGGMAGFPGTPQMLSALEATRRSAASATPKPPSQTPQRPPSTMPRGPGQATPGMPGLPPGLHQGLPAGMSLAPPPTGAGSLTNGTSEQAQQQQHQLLAMLMQQYQQQQQAHLLQAHVHAQQQQQQQQQQHQHQQQQREQQQHQQQQQQQQAAQAAALQQQQQQQAQAAQAQAQQAQAAAAAQAQSQAQAQQSGLPSSAAGLTAQQQQQILMAQASLRFDPNQMMQQQLLAQMAQVDPMRAIAILQQQQQQAQQQQQQQQQAQQQQAQQAGAQSVGSSQAAQMDLIRAHMEQLAQAQQNQQLQQHQQQQQQLQQQQAAQAHAAAQQQAAGLDPAHAALRQMYSQQQAAQQQAAAAAAAGARPGQQPSIEALMAAQAAAQQRLPGFPGMPPTGMPQQPGLPQQQAGLFQPGMMGMQGMSMPPGMYSNKLPYSATLQQMAQLKRDGSDVIPNGR